MCDHRVNTRAAMLPGPSTCRSTAVPHGAAAVLPERDAPLLLCCLSGARSGVAVQWLKAQGYRQVTNGGSVSSVALQLGRPIEQS
jgi:phage shock protein E